MRFWCATALVSAPELPAVAHMLEEAGYHGALLSGGIIYPKELRTPYPYPPHPDGRPSWEPTTPWPDSWVAIGAMAAVTERLCLSNNIYIAPARPILEVARQVATASVLSGGRVALGLGAGWMREEFDLFAQNFDDRGPRLNEMIQALRELWKGGWVEWHGEYYEIPALMMEPHPQRSVPIYCGGHSDAAINRAARYCDGWIGRAYSWDEAALHIDKVKQRLAEYGREREPFEISVGLYDVPSVDLYQRAEEELGITGMLCMPWAGTEHVDQGQAHQRKVSARKESLERYRSAIARFADEIVSRF
jgi:probable F420-dependent oxidoreductase